MGGGGPDTGLPGWLIMVVGWGRPQAGPVAGPGPGWVVEWWGAGPRVRGSAVVRPGPAAPGGRWGWRAGRGPDRSSSAPVRWRPARPARSGRRSVTPGRSP